MSHFGERLASKPWAALILLAGLLLCGTWVLPLIDQDEPRFAEASREMLQRQDFVVPRFNAQYRFDKPPLIYWCQAIAYKILGQNEFAARLPSVLFTVATAALLMGWSRTGFAPGTAVRAALIFGTSLQVLIHGRMALADMPMIFFFTLACWSGWELTRPGAVSRAKWWWIFLVSLALGFLAKGPVAWLPLAGLALARWRRPGQFEFSWLSLAAGMVVSLALISCWGIPALQQTQGQFFSVGIGKHVLSRSFGVMEGHGGSGWVGFILLLPLYLLTFFFSFFPWAFAVPAALRRWSSQQAGDALEWYLLLQSLIVFAVFTLVRTKLPHYILPAVPLLALWLARQASAFAAPQTWLMRRVGLMSALALIITLPVFFVAGPRFAVAGLFRQVQPLCSAEMRVATANFDQPSIVWEFRKVSTNFVEHLSLEQAKAFLGQPGPRLLLLPRKDITAELTDGISDSVVYSTRGLETTHLRWIELAAIVRTNGSPVPAVARGRVETP